MIIATLGILFMALLFIYFQKVLIYQMEKNNAMSLAEKSALIYFYTGKSPRKLEFLKRGYAGFITDQGKIGIRIKDSFMGIKSRVSLKLPFTSQPITEEFNINAPGRIKW